MTTTIRQLGPGDEAILEMLAHEDPDFDVDGRSEPSCPLDPDEARRFLENPAAVQWVALDGERVVGMLFCIVVPLRVRPGHELLLYEIGVRSAWRRRGVGRAMLDAMERWMQAHGIDEVWVLADNAVAVDFYRAGGLASQGPQPLYMTRALSGSSA